MDRYEGTMYVCEFCARELMTLHALRIHFAKMHRQELGLAPSKDDARWNRYRAERDARAKVEGSTKCK